MVYPDGICDNCWKGAAADHDAENDDDDDDDYSFCYYYYYAVKLSVCTVSESNTGRIA